MDEVVVTGIRKSIEDSIDVKKSDSSIVEVVSAEDIGKLPDSSIAEAIARLPGIAAQRTNGRAQTLSIRGLGPDFTVTTFNGREQASTNDNRTVEFDQYPSELVTQVKIYKTPDAGMAYQGIAGTTDIADRASAGVLRRKFAVGYKREMNDQEANIPGLPDAGDRVNLTYIDQFNDNTVGVAFGIAYNKTPYQQQTREPWGYADVDGDGLRTSDHWRRQGWREVVLLRAHGLHGRARVQAQRQPAHAARCLPLGLQRSADHPAHGVRHCMWASATLDESRPGRKRPRSVGHVYNVPFVVIENYNNDRDAKVDSIGLNTKYAVQRRLGHGSRPELVEGRTRRSASRVHGRQWHQAPIRTCCRSRITSRSPRMSNGITIFTPTLDYSDYDSVFLTDPGGWGGGLAALGFRRGIPRSPTRSRPSACRRPAQLEGFLSDVTLRRELRRSHQGEEAVPEQPVAARRYLACGRAGAIPHGHRRHRVLRQPARHDRLRRAGHVPR